MNATSLPRNRRRRRSAARLLPVALLAATAAGPAAAQGDRPPAMPARDVAVTYRLIGGPPGAGEMRTSWLAAEGRQRIELPDGAGAMVVDHKDPSASFLVLDAQRAVLPAPPSAEAMAGANKASGRFTRAGAGSYAGQPCTVWRYEGGEGQASGENCVTEDGVLLRAVGTREGQTGGLEATGVAYGPQDPARFRRPDGYQVVQPRANQPPAAPRQ